MFRVTKTRLDKTRKAGKTDRVDKIKNPGRPTSKDVARLAGVSRTQVSYVMNGTGSNHVSKERQQRILDAAKALGYSPHHSAQALRKGYSNEFSIFFPAPYPPKINAIIGKIHEMGLAQECLPVQYSFNSYQDPERKQEALDILLSRRPVGVFCSLFDLDMEEIEFIRSKGIDKILVLDIEEHEDIATLALPIEAIGNIAARHLVERGHRNIGVLRPFDPVQKNSFEKRLEGMKRALSLVPDAQLQIMEWPEGNVRPTLEHAVQFVDQMLSLEPRPTALYTYGDDYGFNILTALRKRGIRVPDEVAVIGTDNSEYCSLSQPTLTSIDIDTNDFAARAVALINSLITGTSPEGRFLEPPVPELVERESTVKNR